MRFCNYLAITFLLSVVRSSYASAVANRARETRITRAIFFRAVKLQGLIRYLDQNAEEQLRSGKKLTVYANVVSGTRITYSFE